MKIPSRRRKRILTFDSPQWCRSRRPNDLGFRVARLVRAALLKAGPRVRIRPPPAGSQLRTGRRVSASSGGEREIARAARGRIAWRKALSRGSLPNAGSAGDDCHIGDECDPERCFLAVSKRQLPECEISTALWAFTGCLGLLWCAAPRATMSRSFATSTEWSSISC